jgi:mono/diheme cytochrome c family protein
MRVPSIITAVVVAVWIAFTSGIDATANEKLYVDKCASCHAKDGSGSTARGKAMKVPDLRLEVTKKKTDEQLFALIVNAKAHSSVRKQLTDADIRGLVTYMRGLK